MTILPPSTEDPKRLAILAEIRAARDSGDEAAVKALGGKLVQYWVDRAAIERPA